MNTPIDPTTLDRYGRMAQVWWHTHQPTHWQALPDPSTTLAAISREIIGEISDLQAQLQHQLATATDYLAQVAAIRQTQLQAEEIVLNDWFPSEGGPGRLPTLTP